VRSRPRLTVRQALTAWYLLVLGVVIAGFAAALYWDQEQTLSAQVDRSLSGASGQAMALIDKHVDPIKFVDNDAYQHAARHLTQAGYAVLLFDPSRRPLARFGRALDLPPESAGAAGLSTIETTFEGSEEHWRVALQPVVRHDGVSVGYLAVGQSIDAVEQAKSGHPGTPMALAPLVYTIWNRVMRFDPQDPIWPNRDRFVLSNGHASMLIWSMLHLTRTQAVDADYEKLGLPSVTLNDIRNFRQLDSRAPGHPEYRWVSGVETTTGPLGQGVATSVGMAIGEKWLASHYNRSGFEIFNYNIYVVCGDGCMMEGISSESASLAGHLGLDNLCWIYDNNHISIEGNTNITFTEDVAARFLAYGWNVLRVGDANDLDRIEHALEVFRKTKGRPTFIVLDSHIGYGSPNKQDTPEAHGEPLGEEDLDLLLRLAMRSQVSAVDEPLCSVRNHGENYSADRIAEYDSRVNVYGKIGDLVTDPRLVSLCRRRRAEQSIVLAGLRGDKGDLPGVWRTLRLACAFSWSYPDWWFGALKAVARPLAPKPVLNAYRQWRR